MLRLSINIKLVTVDYLQPETWLLAKRFATFRHKKMRLRTTGPQGDNSSVLQTLNRTRVNGFCFLFSNRILAIKEYTSFQYIIIPYRVSYLWQIIFYFECSIENAVVNYNGCCRNKQKKKRENKVAN